MGTKETEEILRSQVTEVCHNYCLQVWKEALDATEVDSTSELRNLERVFYPLALREIALTTIGETSATTSVPQPIGKSADKAT